MGVPRTKTKCLDKVYDDASDDENRDDVRPAKNGDVKLAKYQQNNKN